MPAVSVLNYQRLVEECRTKTGVCGLFFVCSAVAASKLGIMELFHEMVL